jgi:hypothetical protein
MTSMIRILAASAMAACSALTVNAVTFKGTAVGSWQNVVSVLSNDVYSVTNSDVGGVARFNWGTPAVAGGFDNQFSFDGIGSDGDPVWSAPSETAFKLGDFSYRNESTFFSAGVNGVSLNIFLTITDPLGIGSDDFLFNYSMVNTPNNTGNPVLDGDIVNILGQPSPTVFTYAGTNYTLDILGFSNDGGTTIRTDFSSPEGGSANAALYGRITSDIRGIPEGGVTATLVGFGFASLVLLRRRLA